MILREVLGGNLSPAEAAFPRKPIDKLSLLALGRRELGKAPRLIVVLADALEEDPNRGVRDVGFRSGQRVPSNVANQPPT